MWYLLRMVEEFDTFQYKQTTLKGATFLDDGSTIADLEGIAPPLRFHSIVVRQGPDYEQGLLHKVNRADLGASKYSVAGNPSPGDELRFPAGPPAIENENRSVYGYLSFLFRFFRTKLLKHALQQSAPIRDLSVVERDEPELERADLAMIRVYRGGSPKHRDKAEKFFRGFKEASGHGRTRALKALVDAECEMREDLTTTFSRLTRTNVGESWAELYDVARTMVHEGRTEP
jgi:hypothetical protein